MHQRKRHSHFSRLALSFGPEGTKKNVDEVVDAGDPTVSFRSAAFSEPEDLEDSFESVELKDKRIDTPDDEDGQVFLAPIRDFGPVANASHVDPSIADLSAAPVFASTEDDALHAEPISQRRGFDVLPVESPDKATEVDASVLADALFDAVQDSDAVQDHDAGSDDEHPYSVHLHDDDVADDGILLGVSSSPAGRLPVEIVTDAARERPEIGPPPVRRAFGKALGAGCKAAGRRSLKAISTAIGVMGHGAGTSASWLKAASISLSRVLSQRALVLASALQRYVMAAWSGISRLLRMLMPQLRSGAMAALKAIHRATDVLWANLVRMLNLAQLLMTSAAGTGRTAATKTLKLTSGSGVALRSLVLGTIGRQCRSIKAGFGTAMHRVSENAGLAKSVPASILSTKVLLAKILTVSVVALRSSLHIAGTALTSILGGFKQYHLVGLATGSACILLLATASGPSLRPVPSDIMLAIPEKPIRGKPRSLPRPSTEVLLQLPFDQPAGQAPGAPLATPASELASIAPTDAPGSVALETEPEGPALLSPEEALARLIQAVAPSAAAGSLSLQISTELPIETKANADTQTAAFGFLLSEVEKVAGVREFTKAVRAVGLDTLIQPGRPYTLFAPNDAAFAKLGQERFEALLAPDGHDRLRALLTHHFLPEHLEFRDFAGEVRSYSSLADQPIAISATDVIRIGNASMVETDLKAVNMVIHVIDEVLPLPDPGTPASPPSALVPEINAARPEGTGP